MCSRNKRSSGSAQYDLYPTSTIFSGHHLLGFGFERFLDPGTLPKAISNDEEDLIYHVHSRRPQVSLAPMHGKRVPATCACVGVFTDFDAIAASRQLKILHGIDMPVKCDVFIDPDPDYVFNCALHWLISCQSHGENWANNQVAGPTIRAVKLMLKAGLLYRSEPIMPLTASHIATLKRAGFWTAEEGYLQKDIAYAEAANDESK